MKICVSRKSLHSLYIRGRGFATHILRFSRGNVANAIMIQWHDLIIARTAEQKWMVTMMAKIKRTMTVSLEEFGKKAGEYALDEFEYNGLTIRQWADKITSGEYQPVKHGKWENDKMDIPRCSCCSYIPEFNRHIDDYYYSDFCPNCGARMEGDSE